MASPALSRASSQRSNVSKKQKKGKQKTEKFGDDLDDEIYDDFNFGDLKV